MTQEIYDVIVVGGGPAVAARVLVPQGKDWHVLGLPVVLM